MPYKGSSSEEDEGDDEDGEAYANDAWIDYSKQRRSGGMRRESKRSRKERNDAKTAIELCSYGVLYLLLFVGVRMASGGSGEGLDVSRRLV